MTTLVTVTPTWFEEKITTAAAGDIVRPKVAAIAVKAAAVTGADIEVVVATAVVIATANAAAAVAADGSKQTRQHI